MQKHKLLLYTIIIVAVTVAMSGCNMPNENLVDRTTLPPAIQSTSIESTNAPTRNISTMTHPTSTPSQLASVIITATVKFKPTPVTTISEITPTIEPLGTSLSNSQSESGHICSAPPSRFDIQNTLDIYDISSLHFLDEETLVFYGWAPRPTPQIGIETTVSTTPTKEETSALGGFVSARLLFKQGLINLTTGNIISSTLDFASLLNNPCRINCPLEILGESPNQQWQLLQISDVNESQIGVWIVSEDQMVRLVDYVPSSSTWQWSEDSSLLWFVHTTEEHGADSLITWLDQPVTVTRSEDSINNPLDPTYYFLAFSPLEKTVVSTGDPFEQGLPDKDEVYTFDLTQSLSQPLEAQIIPEITNVTWNEATQNYLLSIVQEAGTEIRTLDGNVLARIPGYQMPRLNFALSPLGKYLAIGYGAVDGILVFTCE